MATTVLEDDGDSSSTTTTSVWNYNVTIPDFQEQTAPLLAIADGRAPLSFNPIITQDVNCIERVGVLGTLQEK